MVTLDSVMMTSRRSSIWIIDTRKKDLEMSRFPQILSSTNFKAFRESLTGS